MLQVQSGDLMKDRSNDKNLPELDDDERPAAAIGIVDTRLEQRIADSDSSRETNALTAMLRELRAPPANPDFARRALRSATRPGRRSSRNLIYRTLAATLAFFALLVIASTLIDDRGVDARPAVVAVGNEVRTIKIAIESEQAIEDIEMTIELTDNLALEGFPDRRTIRWNARLERGINVISLPVSAIGGGDGEIVTRIGRQQQSREFVIKTHYPGGESLGQLVPALAYSGALSLAGNHP